jgi:hypothetical protein
MTGISWEPEAVSKMRVDHIQWCDIWYLTGNALLEDKEISENIDENDVSPGRKCSQIVDESMDIDNFIRHGANHVLPMPLKWG